MMETRAGETKQHIDISDFLLVSLAQKFKLPTRLLENESFAVGKLLAKKHIAKSLHDLTNNI
jgi:hypothetical protein